MAEYKCWIEDYGQTESCAEVVNNVYDCAKSAAVQFVRDYERDSAHYPIASNSDEATVSVRRVADGKLFKVSVYGEVVPEYYARQLSKT